MMPESGSGIIHLVPKVATEDKRVRVMVDSNESRVASEVVMAFADSGKVYQRAGFLVEPRLDPARHLTGIMRPVEELRMVPLKTARARNLASEICRFVKETKAGDVEVNPPEWLASAVLSLPDWIDVPVVESIAENPTFRDDGTIHDVPGYDALSGTYFAPDSEVFPKVPEEPTQEEARAAYDTLMDPFVDFPFVAEADRSAAASIILTLLARPAIAGPSPPFVIRTPTPRTGKDLLTDVITIIGTGRPTPGRSLPTNDEELKKLLLSLGLSGCRVASFGNCEGAIGSPALSHAVTREVLSDRLLGANTDVTVPLRLVWIFNGNNPRFKSDFAPRVVSCNMDAGVADPQSRTGWKYYPLLPHVRKQRPNLVVAGLTILRAYHVAGKPPHGRPRKGSFESWDDLVRGALMWIGVPDPISSGATSLPDDDVDLEHLRALLSAWRCAFGQDQVTLAEAVDATKPVGAVPSTRTISEAAKKDLIAAFSAINPKLDDRFTAASLRYYFRHNHGRPVDMREKGDDPSTPTSVLRLEIANPRFGPSKVASWYVLDGNTPRGEKPSPALPVHPTAAPPVSANTTPNAIGKSLFETLLT